MHAWIEVAKVADCPPGCVAECVAGDQIIALYNVEGSFYAIDGLCPHQGGPLGQGQLDGCLVTCPWHGWKFDVRNGQHQAATTLHHPCFAVRVENGCVQVRIGDLDSA